LQFEQPLKLNDPDGQEVPMSATSTPTSTASATRTIDGRVVPAPGSWALDPSHSSVGFVARHLMVTKVRGRFTDYEAAVTIGDQPQDSHLEVTIQVASVTTGDDGRDEHLRSADFFDVDQFPTMRFVSTAVEPGDGPSRWRVSGDLTIRDVSRPVVLAVEFEGAAADPWGNDKASFTASVDVDREDWGLTWNQPLAGGGVLVSKKIAIEIEAQAVRQG
jgi:polyisoprenoid-binding protein YceI